MSLNFITAWRMINDTIKRVLIWRFTLVLIKIHYGQIGDQTGLFYTTNPVFYTSGNRFVRRTGTFENLTFSLVPSDNRNTRSTCPTSVFTGIGQTLMSRPGHNIAEILLKVLLNTITITPLSTIFQLRHSDQHFWWFPEKTTNHHYILSKCSHYRYF
jgi:hypothetical protein